MAFLPSLRPAIVSPLPTPLHPQVHNRTFPPHLARRQPSSRAALKSPRGFGPPAQKRKKPKKRTDLGYDDDDEESDDEYEDETAGTIPEVVTNRMMRRVGLSVGIPLSMGLLFFPFFYYLKVVAEVDVPTWIPFVVSFFFFGAALLGVSYGIVSASWDPLREGSLLGWNEARRNWPVFWDSLWGSRGATSRPKRK